YIDNELANLVTDGGGDAKSTAGSQRVLQRATIAVRRSGGVHEVTGADVLVAMFSERESHAVYFLQEQGMTRFDAVNYISHGIAKPAGHRAAAEHLIYMDRGIFTVGRETPAVEETKIIAAILCTRTVLLEDTAGDPVKNIVDLYERILAELRARGHGGP